MTDALAKFDVKAIDGSHQYRVDVEPRDLYTWESSGRGRSSVDIASGIPYKASYEIAHVVARRLGKTDLKLDEFAAAFNVYQVDPDSDDDETADEPDPTSPAP